MPPHERARTNDGAPLTAQEKRQRSQRPVLRFEALQQRRQSKDIHQGVEEAGVYEWEGICAVHYHATQWSAH